MYNSIYFNGDQCNYKTEMKQKYQNYCRILVCYLRSSGISKLYEIQLNKNFPEKIIKNSSFKVKSFNIFIPAATRSYFAYP